MDEFYGIRGRKSDSLLGIVMAFKANSAALLHTRNQAPSSRRAPLICYTDQMKARIDSPEGQAKYGRRFATVEPVFGNIRHNKQLNRFTLRSQRKVDAQWKLYCLVHNIEKLAHHGYAQ
jgi:hypothetical protein